MEEINNDSLQFEIDTTDLQNIQNQNRNISETNSLNKNTSWSEAAYGTLIKETWSETFYHWFTYGKISKDVFELSKVVSPAETVRRIAKYTINPATGLIDYYTGFKDKKISIKGCEIPCSFSTFGRVATEGLVFVVNPAQWGAYQLINVSGRYLSEQALKYSGVESREKGAAVILGSSLIFQGIWGQIEKFDEVQSVYNVSKKPFDGINSKLAEITKFTDDKIINKALEKMGIDKETPLGLTAADIQRQEKLITAEKNLVDNKEKLEQLSERENAIKKQLDEARKVKNDLEVEKAKNEGIDIKKRIQQTLESEKSCRQKKNKVSRKTIAKIYIETFQKENNLSDQDAERCTHELRKALKHAEGSKQLGKVLKGKSKEYKAILQEQSLHKLDGANRKVDELKQLLDDTRRVKARTEQRDIVASAKEYAKAVDEFERNSNRFQQDKFFDEQRQREEERQSTRKPIDDNLPGNIKFEMCLSEIEDMVNAYIKDNKLFRKNFNDSKNKVFLDLKGEKRIKITHDADNNLQIAVPIIVDNKRSWYGWIKGKVSKIQLEVLFNLQFEESNSEKLINANIDHASFAMKNKVFFKALAIPPKIKVQDTAHGIISEQFSEAMAKIQKQLEETLGKENVFNLINKSIPTGMSVNDSTMSIKPPKIKDGKVTFDADINADFQYQIPAETLRSEFKPFTFDAELFGLSLGRYSIDDIANINMSNGRIKSDISLSGPIAGTLTASFKTHFLENEQRFIVDDVQFDDVNTNSIFAQTINAWPRVLQNCLPLHNKIEETFNDILRNAPAPIIRNLQEQTPGNLSVDKDSVCIRQFLFDNNAMTVRGTVVSPDNYVTNSVKSNDCSSALTAGSEMDFCENRSGFSFSNTSIAKTD